MGAAAAFAVAVAACSSGGPKPSSSSAAKSANPTAPAAATVLEMANSRYGPMLTTAGGFALYTYTADLPGGVGCSGACLHFWPPLLLPAGQSDPVGGPGVTGLGTFNRAGRLQVTFHGLPLYTYIADQRPGQVAGQDIVDSGGKWLLASLSGAGATPTTAVPTTSPSTTAPSGRPAY